MMQSSQERLGDDAANCLNRPRNRASLDSAMWVRASLQYR
jgi:hypothetical protein